MALGQKTGGRTAGTPNKATSELKTRITALVDNQFDTVVEKLEQLDPKEMVAAYLKFLEYVLPKQREQKLDPSTLTEEQLDELIQKIITKLD